MPSPFTDYFHNLGLKVVETSLRHVVGKPVSYLKDEANYRMHLIQPGWQALPVTIRFLMKNQFALWEQLYLALWTEAFDLGGDTIELQPNVSQRVRYAIDTILLGAAPPPPEPPAPEPAVEEDAEITVEDAPAVGIDLGTTFSVIAYVDAQGRPTSIVNGDGERLTPSVVLFGADGTVVGKQAVQGSAMEPERAAVCVKRDMGAKCYRKPINGEYLPPEVISSCILRSLKEDAERHLGPIAKAVITVPAYFDETRRRATVDAGKMAGLEVLDIINEPTAAAIAYGYQLGYLDTACQLTKGERLRVLVYDLGGGTFDVTIVEIGKNEFRALATDGDVYLGGRDWDERLVNLVAERFRSQFREDPRENPLSAQELWLAAESAKRTLTERPAATLYVNHLGSRCKVEVTRAEFEQATADLLERTRLTTEIVIRQAGLTLAIDRVLLVGGATRMPMVVRMLVELTGKVPERSISPDEAVAHGAALFANTLAPTQPVADGEGLSVVDVNAHSLGILGTDPSTGKQFNKILIPKNTPLPHTVVKKFQTYRHGQRAVLVKVLEGESEKPILCTPIGVCTISDLPPDLPAGWPIEVVYTYESSGRLNLNARLRVYDKSVSTEFARENSLPDEDVELWAQVIEQEFFGNRA
jgi:molecular chaperone DnaK